MKFMAHFQTDDLHDQWLERESDPKEVEYMESELACALEEIFLNLKLRSGIVREIRFELDGTPQLYK